jgi:hypothetical protein
MNQPEAAARLSGIARAILETTSFRYEPMDHAEFERHLQIARDQLGDERFEAFTSEGRAMPLEQAIQYAVEIARSL